MVFNAVECNVLQMLPQKTMSYNYEGNDAYFSRLLNYCVNLPIIVADIHNRSNIQLLIFGQEDCDGEMGWSTLVLHSETGVQRSFNHTVLTDY